MTCNQTTITMQQKWIHQLWAENELTTMTAYLLWTENELKTLTKTIIENIMYFLFLLFICQTVSSESFKNVSPPCAILRHSGTYFYLESESES